MEQELNPIVAELKEHVTASQTPNFRSMTSEDLVLEIIRNLQKEMTIPLENLIHALLNLLVITVKIEARESIAKEISPEAFRCACKRQEVGHE